MRKILLSLMTFSLSSLFATAQCPEQFNITANEFCFFLSWLTPPNPLPDTLFANGTYYVLSDGTGVNSDPAIYSNGGGAGACNANQTPFSGTITLNDDTCEYMGGVLPLTLLDFNSVKTGANKVLLTWTTVDEKNIKSIEVQKSIATHNWKTMTYLPPRENDSDQRNRYAYEDIEVGQGAVYYRLKINDLDGGFYFSEIASVKGYLGQKKVSHAIDPQGSVTLFVPGDVKEYDIKVYNMRGREVQLPVLYSTDKVIVSLENYSQGIYLIRYVGPEEQAVIKVLR